MIDGVQGAEDDSDDGVLGARCLSSANGTSERHAVSYLPRTEQKAWRGRPGAYERPTYAEAKRDLKAMRAELDELNQSAVASLDEGFERDVDPAVPAGWPFAEDDQRSRIRERTSRTALCESRPMEKLEP